MGRFAIVLFLRQVNFRYGYTLRFLSCLILAGFVSLPAHGLEVTITASKLKYEDFSATGLRAGWSDGKAVLRVQDIVPGGGSGMAVHEFSLDCDSIDSIGEGLCSAGKWSLTVAGEGETWKLPVRGTLGDVKRMDEKWILSSSVVTGELKGKLSATLETGGLVVLFTWEGQSITAIPAIAPMPEQLQWVRSGFFSGQFDLHVPQTGAVYCDYGIHVAELGFDSPEGRFAGENLDMNAKGRALAGETLDIGVSGEFRSGDLLIDNFYTSFSDSVVRWSAELNKQGTLLSFGKVHITDDSSLDMKAEASLDLEDPSASLRYQVSDLELHFPEAYQKFIESMASAWTLEGLTTTGSLRWSGGGTGQVLNAGVLDVQDVTIVDRKRGRFALTGLAAHIVPGANGVDSRFSWRGLLFQRINLGGGEAGVKVEQGQISLDQPLRLNVLGGVLALQDLNVQLPGNVQDAVREPEIRLYATLEGLDMERLTRALGWPTFGGSVSGKIPGVTLNEGVLAVEGEIEFDVFDGQILLTGLRVERPFGVLPSLAANLQVNNLDLQQLTSTFSFGSISGRMSGFVHDLRMLDWKPVAFDAWLGTPEKEGGSQQISRQAVNKLTNIGGGSATAALTGPFMKLFNNFSYKRLGLGCTLHNNICQVRGLDDDASSVLIMEGAGVPKVMIRAYNRKMDWPTLLGGLTAATEGESIRIGN